MRQTDRRQTKALLNAPALWGRRHNNAIQCTKQYNELIYFIMKSYTRYTIKIKVKY